MDAPVVVFFFTVATGKEDWHHDRMDLTSVQGGSLWVAQWLLSQIWATRKAERAPTSISLIQIR